MASTQFYSFTLLLILFSSISNNFLAAKHGSYSVSRHHHHQHSGSHHGHNQAPPTNPKLQQAYIAFQAWKRVIFSDPNNFITNWVGPNVCNYTGVYCAPAPYDETLTVVAGVDFNHANLAGFLPNELGLLSDLALIHLNSNRFCGVLPNTLSNLTLLFELDLSNNRFVGPFPSVILSLPSLHYLDLRFNEFEGPVPPQLFNQGLDAIIVNNNNFTGSLPTAFKANISPSVIVFANNRFRGCLPPSIANLADSLEELLFINTSLSGCLPPEIGHLYKLKVFDVSYNNLVGPVPYSMAGLYHLQQLNLAHNKLTGGVPDGICALPNLENFTISFNFFCEEGWVCQNLSSKGIAFDDSWNCLPEKKRQRSENKCQAVYKHPVECSLVQCGGGGGGGAAPFAFPPVMVPAAAPLFSIAPSPSNG
ncbi:hypothetical protein SLE2022_234340 [Rubroshorea leprosula]